MVTKDMITVIYELLKRANPTLSELIVCNIVLEYLQSNIDDSKEKVDNDVHSVQNESGLSNT